MERLDLKVELVRRHLSVTEVARRCGVSRGHMSRVLSGKANLDDKLARDLAMATGIPKRTILGEREAAVV